MNNKDLLLELEISADGRYKFDRSRVRKAVANLLQEHGVKGKVKISLAVVGDRKMKELHKKYLVTEETTDVLSFSQLESMGDVVADSTGAVDKTDELVLGDVVVSYPQAKRQALEYYRLLDEEMEFLVCHGVLHLLGIHHD